MQEPQDKPPVPERKRRGGITSRKGADGIVRHYGRYVEADGRRRHVLLSEESRTHARDELIKIKARVRQGLPGLEREEVRRAAPGLTLRALAAKFCGKAPDWKGDGGADTRDPKHYRRQFWSVLKCHVLPVVGDMPANEVRRSDVVRVIDAMKGEKRRTTQKATRNISRLYTWALDRELVTCANPAQRQRTPKYQESNSYYRDDEVARLLAKAPEHKPDLYPIVATAYYAGLRKGELAALRWADVDLKAGRADVSRSWAHAARKSGAAVVVHLHPRLLAILTAHYERQKPADPDALVFPDPVTGGMRDKWDLWGLDDLIKLAEVRRFKRPWHSFRHSHGTSLAAHGASLAEIQEALGQTTLEMARRYVKTAAEQVKARVHALPDLAPADDAVVDINARRAARGHGRRHRDGHQQDTEANKVEGAAAKAE